MGNVEGHCVDYIDLGITRGYRTMIITHPKIEGALASKVGLPYTTLINEETIAQYVKRVDEHELVEVTIKMAISQKTIKAQSFALNALKHPPSTKPYLPDFRSQQAYRYALRFDPAEALPEVDLVSEFKGIENAIVNKAAPEFIQKVYDDLPEPMQKRLTGMHDSRARMHFIAGVAGSGKTFLMESLILFAISGSGLEQPHKLKVLYIMRKNVGIETTCQRTRTFRDWGFTDEQLNHVLNIMRLYPLEGEIRSAVTEAQRQDQSQDDVETTDLVDEIVTSEVIRSLCKNVFDAKEALVKSKNANRDKSLRQSETSFRCRWHKRRRRRTLRLLGELAPKSIRDEIIWLLYVSLD